MQLKRTWCCSQLLYHNKNRLFSQSGGAPCWGMICHKSTFKCSENHNAFLEMSHMTRVRAENAFTYFRGWPEAVIWSSVFPQEAGSQAPLQGWWGERETAGGQSRKHGWPKGASPPQRGSQVRRCPCQEAIRCQEQWDAQSQCLLTKWPLVTGMPSASLAVLQAGSRTGCHSPDTYGKFEAFIHSQTDECTSQLLN